MATIHYRNAVFLINGADVSGDVQELSINYSVETLDATAMGATARVKKGGLFVAQITSKILFDTANGVPEDLLFPLTGSDFQVLAVYPNGVTEQSTNSGSGFGCRGVLSSVQIGGAVGTLLTLAVTFEGQGLGS